MKLKQTLSNIDIDEIMKKLRLKYNGIRMRDELDVIPAGWMILNLNTSDQGGSHWTCFKNNFPSQSIYFDSFGFVAPEELDILSPYEYNNTQLQGITSEVCGYYCICFINFMEKTKHIKNDKVKMDKFIEIFKEPKLNEDILKNYFESIII